MADNNNRQTVPAVKVSRLVYRYPDGNEALSGVDLEIWPGESVSLVGPNGAGKSTLLLHLNGLLPGKTVSGLGHVHGSDGRDGNGRRISPGRVCIDGIEVNSKSASKVRERVGLVFQDPDDQLFCNTVLEDVAFGPLNQGKSPADARRIALECLARVELGGVADRPPHHLSFGERKRACLAGVLACEPTVLVLDEPTANLDPLRPPPVDSAHLRARLHPLGRHPRPGNGPRALPARFCSMPDGSSPTGPAAKSWATKHWRKRTVSSSRSACVAWSELASPSSRLVVVALAYSEDLITRILQNRSE